MEQNGVDNIGDVCVSTKSYLVNYYSVLCRVASALSRYHPIWQVALEGLGSGMLGEMAVRRKVVASETVTQADALQWTVVFLSKVPSVPHPSSPF